jgi:hypothetical protein
MKFIYLVLALVIVLSAACITVVQPGATVPGSTAASTEKPAAFIDRISPSSLNWGESVNFTGHGTAPSGTITAYLWRSSIDGDLGSTANFDTIQLSPGKHIVLFSVQDSAGNWSLETQGTVNVITEAVADGGGAADGGDPGTLPPPPDPGSGTPALTPPVINSFNAAPAGITAGATSTLSWDVSNATAVTISPVVGSVGLTGTWVVSPAVDTTYTLTAANMAYFGQVTTKVTVAAAAAAPKPDLIIEDVWRSGDKIYYRIKNQGTAAAPGTVTRLTIDGAVKSTDSVPALAAGANSTQNFSGYAYTCGGISDSVVVLADSNNVATESNGANNSRTETFNCLSAVGPVGPLAPLEPLGPLLTLKPDLIVSNITAALPPSNHIKFTAKNTGSVNAGAFDAKLYVNNVLKDTLHVDTGLVAGGTTIYLFPSYGHVCAMGAHYTVKVLIDSGGAVTETDETNNSRTETWGCPSPL